MSRFRVSIAGLLAGIALTAVALAALVHPSPLWANAWYSLAAGWLTLAVLGAIYSRGRRRVSFVGFAICGWAYFLGAQHDQSGFLTTAILEISYPYSFRHDASSLDDSLGDASSTTWESWTAANRFIAGGPRMPMMYARVGHAIFCLLFAQLGSLAAVRFRELRDREATC